MDQLNENFNADRELKKSSKKYSGFAREYMESGFNQPCVAELLQVKGCKVEHSHEIAEAVFRGMPDNYLYSGPPVSYLDIKKSIDKMIKTASKSELKKYFDQFYPEKRVINRILKARDSNSESLVEQVHREIEPFIENVILTNMALAKKITATSYLDAKEQMEEKLFGIWPVYLIQKKETINKVEQQLINRTKPENVSIF